MRRVRGLQRVGGGTCQHPPRLATSASGTESGRLMLFRRLHRSARKLYESHQRHFTSTVASTRISTRARCCHTGRAVTFLARHGNHDVALTNQFNPPRSLPRGWTKKASFASRMPSTRLSLSARNRDSGARRAPIPHAEGLGVGGFLTCKAAFSSASARTSLGQARRA